MQTRQLAGACRAEGGCPWQAAGLPGVAALTVAARIGGTRTVTQVQLGAGGPAGPAAACWMSAVIKAMASAVVRPCARTSDRQVRKCSAWPTAAAARVRPR